MNTISAFCRVSVLLLLSAFVSWSDDGSHLEPVEGYLSSYEHSHHYLAAVRDILVGDAVKSPAAMATLPSLEPESVVFLQFREGTMFVVSATTSRPIWGSKKNDEIKVIRNEIPISAQLAEQIGELFASATAQARYPENKIIGFDGVTYHFSSFVVGIGIRAGQIWTPNPETIVGKLVTLGEHLHGFAKGNVTEETLQMETKALLVDLRNETIRKTQSDKNVTLSLAMAKTNRMDSKTPLEITIENRRQSVIGATPYIEIHNSSGEKIAETELGKNRFWNLRPLPEGASPARMAEWERGPKIKSRLTSGQSITEKVNLADLFKLIPGKYQLEVSSEILKEEGKKTELRVEDVLFEVIK